MSVDAKRFPVRRRGERDPIEPYKRRLIYERDGYRCLRCGNRGIFDYLQLDHVTPWSAFPVGTPPEIADRSDNLRTLCEPCNTERSNFDWGEWQRVVGVTECCWDCVWNWDRIYDLGLLADEDRDFVIPEETIAAYCADCGVTSRVPNVRWLL